MNQVNPAILERVTRVAALHSRYYGRNIPANRITPETRISEDLGINRLCQLMLLYGCEEDIGIQGCLAQISLIIEGGRVQTVGDLVRLLQDQLLILQRNADYQTSLIRGQFSTL